jgi:hypothetical protein
MHRLNTFGVKISNKITKYIYKPYIDILLSSKLNYNFEIERLSNNSQSILRTILFQKDWYYYKLGILFKRNIFIELLGKSIIGTIIRFKKMAVFIDLKSFTNKPGNITV